MVDAAEGGSLADQMAELPTMSISSARSEASESMVTVKNVSIAPHVEE